ncbi:MAG: rhomboid family intramembrane serine protease [Pseudomonadota bacterium]
MFPIRDHNPSRRVPFVTYGLLAINVVIFLSYQMLEGRDLAIFYNTWGMVPVEITSGVDLHTLLTSMFLHGGWMHLVGNMLYLWIFGDNMEDAMGHGPFAAFYGISGLLASCAQILWDPSSPVPNIGASGAIAGVLGGYLLLYPKARVDVLFFFIIIIRIVPIPAWIVLGAWLALQVVNGVLIDTQSGGVAYWAHAGGFVAGALLTLPLWRKRGARQFWSRTHGHPPHPETRYRLARTNIPHSGGK